MEIFFAVLIGFILDLFIGDPDWLPHPVQLIGCFIQNGEKLLYDNKNKSAKNQYIRGAILTIAVILLSFIIPFAVLYFASLINFRLKFIVHCIFCYQIMATKSLKTESMHVHKYIVLDDIKNAREYLSRIVGRDTQNLNTVQIIKATIETIAENTSDGVIAPLLFMAIGGAPLGFLYKAVNTLDSMIGYKNDKYMYFGRFAAKLDDVFNFIPAILSAYIMIIATYILKLNTKNAIAIYKRDKYNHASPNSAKTESVCAGALDIQLAGDSYYFGKLVQKKTIGDDNIRAEAVHIQLANKLMVTSAVLSLMLFLGTVLLREVVF